MHCMVCGYVYYHSYTSYCMCGLNPTPWDNWDLPACQPATSPATSPPWLPLSYENLTVGRGHCGHMRSMCTKTHQLTTYSETNPQDQLTSQAHHRLQICCCCMSFPLITVYVNCGIIFTHNDWITKPRDTRKAYMYGKNEEVLHKNINQQHSFWFVPCLVTIPYSYLLPLCMSWGKVRQNG